MATDGSSQTGDRAHRRLWLWLVLWLLLPAALYCIPLARITHGRTLCLWHNLFGVERCYGCGITRALFSLLHFDFAAAWAYNPLVVIVAPGLLYLYIKEIIRIVRKL